MRGKLNKLHKLHELLAELGYLYCYYNTCDTPATGYAGVAMLCKVRPVEVKTGFLQDNPVPDIEGRVITAVFEQCVMINVYFPTSGLEGVRAEKRREFNTNFSDHVLAVKQLYAPLPVMLIGDMNVVSRQFDCWDLPRNPARALWPSCTDWERSTYAKLLVDAKLTDAYAMIFPNAKHGKYTWFETAAHRRRNRGMRIDYVN